MIRQQRLTRAQRNQILIPCDWDFVANSRCACKQAGIKEGDVQLKLEKLETFLKNVLELKIQLEEELRGKAQVEGMQQWVALERISTPHDMSPVTQVSRLPEIDGHLKYVPSAEQGTTLSNRMEMSEGEAMPSQSGLRASIVESP
ncbi:hypothetical protein T09_5822 [Trichinella sp. T9]|nr:hypothetical protein T09_5822 [Trichinella sp. T9]